MDIVMKGAQAVTQLINMLGVGIPLSMALREFVVNGIEACLRNEKEKSVGVYVVRDHENPKKLSVINVGGDFLGPEIITKHLATLGASGNALAGGVSILENNKGIGAKISYLPKAILGLRYRSIEKGEDFGIKMEMCLDQDRGVYTLPSSYCPIAEVETSFPHTDKFSPYILNASFTGTEVVCLGSSEDEDTWRTFDKATNSKKSKESGGTGYGLYKYLTHRFFNPPEVPVRVGIYNRETDELEATKQVKGLLESLMKKSKEYGTLNLTVEVGTDSRPVSVIAHWCILHDYTDTGYRSNWASSGFTALAWRGETYLDSNQHFNSKKSDLKHCGVIVKSDKVIVIFEFAKELKMGSSPDRTELYWDNMKLDKSIFHEAFCNNLPKELKKWQEGNQASSNANNNIKEWAQKQLKALGYGTKPNPTAPLTTGGPGQGTNTGNGNGGSGGPAGAGSGTGSKPKPRDRLTGHKQCRNHVVPEYNFIDDPCEPLLQYHDHLHTITINYGHSIFKYRLNRIMDKFGAVCLIKESIQERIREELYLQTIVRLFEIVETYSNAEERNNKWSPDKLEGVWTLSVDASIYKSLKDLQHQKVLLAA